MDVKQLSQAELQVRCAWCHKVIPEEDECFGAGTKLNPAGKRIVEGREGMLTTLRSPDGHDIIVIVTSKDSKARTEGHDVFFQTCSEECSAKVSAALRA